MSGHRKWSEIKAERAESEEWKRLLKVVEKMRPFDLLEHLDAAGSGMARATQDYRKHQEKDSLLEIQRSLMDLHAVTEELLLRHEAHEEL